MLTLVCAAALVAALALAVRPLPAQSAEGDDGAVELTIYNSDLALVRERRALEIPAGTSTVLFRDISARINPATVSFTSLTSPSKVRVREQNYEYDLVEDAKLLNKFIGERITIVTRGGEVYQGYLLSGARGASSGTIVLSAGPDGTGEVTTVHSGDIQSVKYPSLPEGLITRPTLAWLVTNSSETTSHECLVTYLTGGLSWSTDYVAVIGPKDDTLDLTGWVTVTNESGTTFRDAKLKLVAGDVNRMADELGAGDVLYAMRSVAEADAKSFEEKAFFEYHLYTLQFPTTLKESQVKQIELLSAASVPVKKVLIYDGARDDTKVKVELEFLNRESDGLGIPLPKGVIRVSKEDTDGSLEFIGEDRIDHTPKDEKIRIQLGSAFDVVGSRIETGRKHIGDKVREESYKIEVKNHKEEPVEVHVRERFSWWLPWEIVTASASYTKVDAGTIEFSPTIKPGGTATITYTVRYTR
jgi:hypothetical protein